MLEVFFAPRGVAIVGASLNPAKLGYGVARNLVISGYLGQIHFVNPRGGRLFDRPIYPDLASVPDPVDLAMILIPAASVPKALEDCGARGIRAVIIGSGGFRETGAEGRQLEERCLEIARRLGMRILGPNCIGLLDTHLPLDTTFLPLPGPIAGDIAFLSHSGAICEAVIDWARGQGFGLSRLVSLGNQMDLTEADLLPATAADPHTRVVAMYLEGVGDGRSFIEQASQVTRHKPVVAIKVGRSRSGREAVASHTGALAGRDAAFAAAFRKAGVIRAETTEEVFDWARALAWCPLPGGRQVAVLTNAGGPGAIAADALEANGLERAPLSEATRRQLQEFLPPAASLRNPVDMLAGAGPTEYAAALGWLLADETVDAVMVILVPPPMTTAAEVAGAVIPLIRSAVKPVVMVLMGEDLITHAARLLRQARIPDYRFPERAASALRILADRAQQQEAVATAPGTIAGIRAQEARSRLEKAHLGDSGLVDPETAAAVLACYGIRVPPATTATTEAEAAEAAARIGWPVVAKLVSRDRSHKSDIGGVVVGLRSQDEVRQAYRQIATRAEAASAIVDGVLVQTMADEGQEVVVGVVRDEQFGPLVMFGTGGIEVEASRDVAFGLAPLTRREAEELLEETWAGRRLRGYRSTPPADREAALQAVLRLGQLAVDFPEILEAEINPLRVLPEGRGALALDVRLRLAVRA
ncbi:MAG: acetate--CoA ligase family protein [Chloroflexota bacterium]